MALNGKKIAVAIAGIDVNIPNWEQIIWGNPKESVFGRAARALTVAEDVNADLLIFNTAASKTPEGIVESEATRRYTLEHLDDIFPVGSPEYDRLKTLLEDAFVDLESIDTFTKARVAVRECVARGINILIFVSDETHSTRMMRDLIIAKGNEDLEVGVWVADGSFGPPSFVGEYPINTTDINLVLSKELQLPNLLPRILDTSKDKREDFLKELNILLKKFDV